jgi:DNA-binding NarL/FixJ family response regulator
VAELAAAGRTNREIAQELFVTPKTVENQLGRAYAKLGVSSRKALDGALTATEDGTREHAVQARSDLARQLGVGQPAS